MYNVCAARVSTAASYNYLLTDVVIRIHCDVISCDLAQRGVWRGECCYSTKDSDLATVITSRRSSLFFTATI